MKVISIWQPYASLILHGFKFNETRSWCAPRSLIGQRIGIAATKNITADQRACYYDLTFQRHYSLTGLDPLDKLPRGALLGSVLLHSCDLIDEETMEDITDEERAFGWYAVGRWAWRLRDPKLFQFPIPIRGQQGVFDWNAHDVLPVK